MFSLNKTNATVFTKIKDLSLDDCELAKNEMNKSADLAGKVKIGAGIIFGSSTGGAFVSSLRTLGGSRVAGPLLALATSALSVLSYDAMKVAENVEAFATSRAVRISATKSPEIFAGYLTKNTRFLVPLYQTTLVRHLDKELPKSRNGKFS